MAEKVLIFGKNTWPHTVAAREAFAKKGRSIDYYDVVSDKSKLDTMLKYSNGNRKVPVIVDQGTVTIGYMGKGWKV